MNLHTLVDGLTKSHVYGGRPIPTVSDSADERKEERRLITKITKTDKS